MAVAKATTYTMAVCVTVAMVIYCIYDISFMAGAAVLSHHHGSCCIYYDESLYGCYGLLSDELLVVEMVTDRFLTVMQMR